MSTTLVAVQNVLGVNWDGVTDLQPYIDTAAVFMSQAAACALTRGITFSVAEAEMMERWLAAHCYVTMDPIYVSKSTSRASGSFQRGSGGKGFEVTDYGRIAIQLDPSGCLQKIGSGGRPTAYWAGSDDEAGVMSL